MSHIILDHELTRRPHPTQLRQEFRIKHIRPRTDHFDEWYRHDDTNRSNINRAVTLSKRFSQPQDVQLVRPV
jgi:hypothetical protein